MGSRIKRRNKAVNKMLAGKITVEEARRRAGGQSVRKAAGPGVAKAQQARGTAGMDAALAGLAAELSPRRPVTEADVRDAIRRPMVMPPAAKAARKARPPAAPRGESPQQVLKVLGDMQAQAAMIAAPRVVPVSSWSPAQREMWRQAHEHYDPREREANRAALEKSLAGPEPAAARSVQVIAWGAGPDGTSGWQPGTAAR